MVVKKPERVKFSIRKEKVEKPPEIGISVGKTVVPVEFEIEELTEEEKKEIKPAILDVVLYTSGFDVSPEEKTRRIELYPWTYEEKTDFEIIPTEEGCKAISLLILQDGTRLLGDIQLKVEVFKELPTEVEDASANLSCKLKEFDPTQPDVILDIFHIVQSEEEDEYEFRLFAYEPYLPMVPKPIKRVINRKEKMGLHNLLKAISEFQIYLKGVERPEELGMILYNYIPSEIREELKRIKPKNLLIITDDSEIPWEYAFDGEDFWCMKYNIGKLLRDEIRYHSVRECPPWEIKNIAIACSNPYNDLKYATKEVEEIRHLSKFGKCFENEKIDRISFKLLFLKEIGIFHYIGHCKIEEEPRIILCENEYLTSQEIEEQFDALNKLCPLVVLNSCYGGYLGKELDGFARGFIKAGARAFIGPVFGITDEEAFEFATKFYSYLYSGKTLGEALIETRKELKRHGMAWDGMGFIYVVWVSNAKTEFCVNLNFNFSTAYAIRLA